MSVLVFLAPFTSRTSPEVEARQPAACAATGPLARLDGVPEASGLAASRRVPGRFWTHNDSGAPVLYAIDRTGAVAGRVHVTGAAVEDWEAVAVAPCNSASCIYVADIGDNEAARSRVTLYRLPEPENPAGNVAASGVFHAVYPDGPQDAETLFVANGRAYIVTKGDNGPVAVYRFPEELQAGNTMTLERMGQIAPAADARARITDGAVSPDGNWVALRSTSALMFYRASELLAGRGSAVVIIDLSPLNEPQGEGVAFGANGTLFLAGEGGGDGRAGTLAHLPCEPPR